MLTGERQFTVADLENFPDDGNRYEVIDGELYVTTAPHFEHQFVLNEVDFELTHWSKVTGRGLVFPGVGVIFAVNAGVVPDLVWVSAERFPVIAVNPQTGRRDGKLYAAPELVVEVLSPGRDNEERDRETKLTLYSRRGVREYWIVDRFTQRVEVFRRNVQAALELATTLTSDDTVTSPLLPDFALPVEQIFRLPEALLS
jgi:Uma2 family endonuclease